MKHINPKFLFAFIIFISINYQSLNAQQSNENSSNNLEQNNADQNTLQQNDPEKIESQQINPDQTNQQQNDDSQNSQPLVPEKTASETPKIVFIMDNALIQEFGYLREVVVSNITELNINLQIVSQDSMPSNLNDQLNIAKQVSITNNPVLIFWFDISPSDQTLLYLTDADAERVFIRRIPGESLRLRIEAAGIILKSIVEYILRGGEIGIRARQIIENEKRPAVVIQEFIPRNITKESSPSQPPENSKIINVGLGYNTELFSDVSPYLIHGFFILPQLKITKFFSIGLIYQFCLPFVINYEEITLELNRHRFGLEGIFSFKLSNWELSAIIGLSGDYFSNSIWSGGVLDANNFENDWSFSTQLYFHAGYWFGNSSQIYLKIGADFNIVDKDYLIISNGVKETIFSPLIVNPSLSFGISFDVI